MLNSDPDQINTSTTPEKVSPFFIRELRNIPELREAKRKYCGPNLTETIGVALLCWFQLVALGATALLSTQLLGPITQALVFIYVIVFSGRALRGLEGMFHEGSHRLLHKSMRVNDVLTNFLCGAVFGKSVQSYRPGHWGHHRYLGSESEADRTNYDRREYATLDRSNFWRYALDILRRYPLFLWDCQNEIRSCRFRASMFISWHILITGLLLITLGWTQALLVLGLVIWLPMVLVLPALRMMGEAEEHPYEKIPSLDSGPHLTFDATLNNVGLFQQAFVHPFGDCWHIVHHLIPNCRQIRQRDIHRLLLKHSPLYRQSILVRTQLLTEEQQHAL